MSSPTFSYSPLDTQRREIRLLTLFPGSPNDPIHCDIKTYPLTSCHTFNALSYVWGDATTAEDPENTIQLDGKHRFPATANLRSALRHLRPWAADDKDQCMLLWVDAICINQTDIDERSQQVSMMRDIYASAERVMIWLGEDDENTLNGVFDWIEEIQDLKSNSDDVTTQKRESLMRQSASFFFTLPESRPWFSRVWILQELAMAENDPLVICGLRSVPWSTLLSVWRDLAREFFSEMGRAFTRQRPKPTGASENDDDTLILAKTKLDVLDDLLTGRRANGGETLRRLLIISRTSQSTNPKDRIYALLGLLSPNEISTPDSIPIPVDYRKPIWEVYSDAVSHIFSRGEGPYFLSGVYLPCIPSTNTPHDLPTWVPDFSRQTSDTATQPSRGTRYHPPAPQSASGAGAECMNGHRLPDKQTLRVEGLLVDTIQDIIPMGKTFHELCTRQFPEIDALAKVARQQRCCSPLYGDPSFAAIIDRLKTTEPLWKTLVHNKQWMSGYDVAPDSYGSMHASLLDQSGRGRSGGDTDTSVGNEHEGRNEYEKCLEESVADQSVFFATKNGFVGTCVADGQLGDVVALWFGSPVPFILRPVVGRSVQVDGDKRDIYQLVGASYVGGIMAGEMVDKLYCEDLMDSTTFFVQ